MEMKSYENGTPSWVDLGTADQAKAMEFYAGLFGWDVQDGPPEAGGYRMAMLKDKPVAGLGPQQNPGTPYWSTYISVDDAAAVTVTVTDLGGSVLVAPMDVMGFGHMAVLADPQGAVFSIWQPGTHKGAGLVNEPGAFSWCELITTDVTAASGFYASVFGWEAETHGDPGSPGGYTEFKVSGRSVAGMMAKPPNLPAEVPPFWAVYFSVADTDAAVARITELGGTRMMGPTDIEPGRFAVVADPAGAVFNVIAVQGGLTS